MFKLRQKSTRLSFILCVTIGVLLTPSTAFALTSSTPLATSPSFTRLGGTDQYETAAKIAEQGWTDTADSVVLSSGMSNALVDALAAGPLAAQLKAPILLTDNGQALNPSTKAELLRLKPKKAYITSGKVVIKQSVLDEISALGITPVPLGGKDQYETSVNIAQEMIAQGANVTQVVVAAGWMAPVDALSVSSIAASLGIPILTTTHDALPPATRSFLSAQSGITDSYVIGGTAVVGDAIASSLPGTVHRYSGVTKFDTNLEVLKGFADKVQYDKVYVANGETFVDALSGTSLATLTHSPIILSQSEWSNTMTDFLKLKHLQNVVALGGAVAVPDNILQRLTAIANGSPNAPVTSPVTSPVTPSQPSTVGVGGGVVSTPSTPTVSNKVTVSKLQVNTDPANSLGTFNNGAVIDLSGLNDSVKVLGFSLTADQDCTLQFKVLNNIQNISLVAGQQKDVTVGDLITGGQIQDGVDLSAFRLIYKTKTLQGQLLKNGTSAGTLTVTLKFKN